MENYLKNSRNESCFSHFNVPSNDSIAVKAKTSSTIFIQMILKQKCEKGRRKNVLDSHSEFIRKKKKRSFAYMQCLFQELLRGVTHPAHKQTDSSQLSWNFTAIKTNLRHIYPKYNKA